MTNMISYQGLVRTFPHSFFTFLKRDTTKTYIDIDVPAIKPNIIARSTSPLGTRNSPSLKDKTMELVPPIKKHKRTQKNMSKAITKDNTSFHDLFFFQLAIKATY
ncbi:hypothetical protein ACTG2M_13505 [Aeromonas veronii]|uniref:hypothetical protein n=1 Tax=Aeromonas veronii TaxID=654 RepID=UPI003F79845D